MSQYKTAEDAWREVASHVDADAEMQKLKTENVRTVTIYDEEYPELLKQTYQPPQILYYKGTLPAFDWSIAIVGTRKPTEYGKTACHEFAEALARAGAVIVSGLAYGIDGEAHKSTLAAGGTAVAVIGSGLDHPSFYPPANWALAEKIIGNKGAVISEYPPGTRAFQSHFPERNRIIAGLSHGVLLAEAKDRSGTQITARLAMEENRDVFAVPGSIFSETSKGPNRLIKDGAIPALSPKDILEFYGKEEVAPSRPAEVMSELEQEVLLLLREPALFDDLKAKSGQAVAELQATLSLLELKGKIRELEPGRYQATSLD
ncbi:MAG: DNA-protecting protein DprA [Candidatus Sungbacteria bacterium]|nr:DNA-protecting protein DprA [Candidatus Sungbacteria bacterium]